MRIEEFALERYFGEYEFSVQYTLCSSDCETISVRELLDFEPGAEDELLDLRLGYTEAQGGRTLRTEIARLYESVGPDDVLVCSGAEEAIFLFMHAVLGEGDHAVVQWPCYQSLFEAARSTGCRVSRWRPDREEAWHYSVEALEKLISPDTKAIIINNPHNPTGHLMTGEEFDTVQELARESGAVLFSDEVYRGLEYDEEDRLPAGCDCSSNTISLGVMSKAYGLAGLRIGWVAARNRSILERMNMLKDYTTICNSAPSEKLAELALRHGSRIVEQNRAIIRDNLSRLDLFFSRDRDRFQWMRPDAGPIGFPKLLSPGADADRFCSDVRENAGVLLLPGSLYGDKQFKNHFRIGFGRKNMPEALSRLEAFLKTEKGR
jgi:aspartate/methionine/tyrosine aminotransferase